VLPRGGPALDDELEAPSNHMLLHHDRIGPLRDLRACQDAHRLTRPHG
jgi:hypothetical protein